MLFGLVVLGTLVVIQGVILAAKDIRIAELQTDLDVLQATMAWDTEESDGPYGL